MLYYFETKTSHDQQQIAMQKDVSLDIRDYLNVDQGIIEMLFGNTKQIKDKKSFYELKEDNKEDNSVIGNQTEQQFLTNPEENL